MITVPEAARLAGRNPETIRRWIREGKLPARKIGTQHVIEGTDLDRFLGASSDRGGPAATKRRSTSVGEVTPDVSAAIRRSRATALAALIADGRVTPALDADTENLPVPVPSSSGITATATLLAERAHDRR